MSSCLLVLHGRSCDAQPNVQDAYAPESVLARELTLAPPLPAKVAEKGARGGVPKASRDGDQFKKWLAVQPCCQKASRSTGGRPGVELVQFA